MYLLPLLRPLTLMKVFSAYIIRTRYLLVISDIDIECGRSLARLGYPNKQFTFVCKLASPRSTQLVAVRFAL